MKHQNQQNHCSVVGALYFWGQTKAAGEAAMYPKLVQDLSGWRVRSMGCW